VDGDFSHFPETETVHFASSSQSGHARPLGCRVNPTGGGPACGERRAKALAVLCALAALATLLCAETQPEHLSLVRKMGSADRAEREKAQAVLLAIGSAAAPALLDGLDSDNPDVRGACARLLGKLDFQDAKPRLKRALEDKAFFVRWMALDALAALATPDDADVFAKFLSLRPEAAETRQAVELLALRRTAAVGLYRAGGEAAKRTLRAGLKDPEALVRRTCAFGLGHLKDRESVPDLIAALSDQDTGVREKADLALQWISGQKTGFEPDGLPLARDAAIEKWKQWWRANAESRKLQPPE
jgi:HEAT repeat protein